MDKVSLVKKSELMRSLWAAIGKGHQRGLNMRKSLLPFAVTQYISNIRTAFQAPSLKTD